MVVTSFQAWASAHTPRHRAVHRRGTAASKGAWRAKGRGFALGDGGRARWRPGAQTTADDDPRDQAGNRKRLRLARIAVIVIDAEHHHDQATQFAGHGDTQSLRRADQRRAAQRASRWAAIMARSSDRRAHVRTTRPAHNARPIARRRRSRAPGLRHPRCGRTWLRPHRRAGQHQEHHGRAGRRRSPADAVRGHRDRCGRGADEAAAQSRGAGTGASHLAAADRPRQTPLTYG